MHATGRVSVDTALLPLVVQEQVLKELLLALNPLSRENHPPLRNSTKSLLPIAERNGPLVLYTDLSDD